MKFNIVLPFTALSLVAACNSGEVGQNLNASLYNTWAEEVAALPRPVNIPVTGTATARTVLMLETPDGTMSSPMPLTIDFGADSGSQITGYADNFILDGQELEGGLALANATIFPFSTGSVVDRLADGKGNITSTLTTEVPISLPNGKLMNVHTPLFGGGFVGELGPTHITLEDDNAPGWYGTDTRRLTPDEDRFSVNAQLRGTLDY